MGITAPLLVANSNGGLARAAVAMEKPVFFVSSGRAAGAAGAVALGRRIGQADLVAFDMGGTTASAALIAGGVLSRTTEYEFRAGISTPSRFIKAGGYLDARAHRRRRRDRQWRRLDRPCGRRRTDLRRAALGRRRAGTGLLRRRRRPCPR